MSMMSSTSIPFNPTLLALARKYREMTQAELHDQTGISQAHLSKIEQGLQSPTATFEDAIASALRFPVSFFHQEARFFPPLTPFHRKRAGLGKKIQERAEALGNLKRIHILKLLPAVNIDVSLPHLDIENYKGDATLVAQAIRGFFHLPRGPVENVTDTLENHGLFIFHDDLGSVQLDAFTLIGEKFPAVFLNKSSPPDRLRLSLAHELGHIVMHEIINSSVEDEAWLFAGEFLMPAVDIKDDLRKARSLTDFADLKRKWKVSMAALIRRSHQLGVINDERYRYLMQCMAPYRVVEPVVLPVEKPTLFDELLETYFLDMKYTQDELLSVLCIDQDLYDDLYKETNSRCIRLLKYGNFKSQTDSRFL